jgi:hypothetical protein
VVSEDGMTWTSFTDTLSRTDHGRLMQSLGSARDALRQACDLAAADADPDAVREQVFEAVSGAAPILGPIRRA